MSSRPEKHLIQRVGWLRAAVLGANDGIVSTASLILGVAAASSSKSNIVLAGIAGLVSGAMSMAAGEYVSVSSQADTENADLARERQELRSNQAGEKKELAMIYVQRGLEPELARTVARQLMARDALAAHARDELNISQETAARPVQAAMASAASFSAGAALPLAAVLISSPASIVLAVCALSLMFLIGLGVAGARAGGSPPLPAAIRVSFWGAFAMAVTAGIGRLVGAVV